MKVMLTPPDLWGDTGGPGAAQTMYQVQPDVSLVTIFPPDNSCLQVRHGSEDGDPQWGGDKETAEENIILINRQRQVSQDKCRYQLLCSSPLGTLTQFVKSSLLAHACDPLSFSQSILSYTTTLPHLAHYPLVPF